MSTTKGDGGSEWSAAFEHASADGMAAYEEALVGPMFTPWAEYLLDALSLGRGDRLLDVATGPGTVARLASARIGPSGFVLATDVSPAMLAIAYNKAPLSGGAPIEYRQSPAAPLDAPDSSFDVASCQQGLQFFPDRGGALREIRRALRPGGRIGVAVWSSIDRCPPFAVLKRAIGEVLGPEAGERYASGPWSLYAPHELTELVRNAGFDAVTFEEVSLPVRFAGGAAQLERSFAASALAAEIRALDVETRAALSNATAVAVRGHLDSDGAVSSYLSSQVVVAVAG